MDAPRCQVNRRGGPSRLPTRSLNADDREKLGELLARLGVPPGQCLLLEDSFTGAEAGLSAGMSVIVVPDLSAPPDECTARVLMVAGSLQEATPHVLRAVLNGRADLLQESR